MTLASRRALAIATGLVLATGGSALAQSAEAESLFRDGRALIKSGKLAAGCDKLEASEKLESSVGTLLNLGDCREKQGRTATAWAAFRKAEATAKRAGDDAKRMAEAKRRADKLEAKLSKLVVQVDRPVPGIVVKRDDEVVEPAVWGSPVPVDPDKYTIVVEAPGHTAWRSDVVVDAKQKRKVVFVPQLARAAVTEPPPVEPAPPPGPPPVATGREPVTPSPPVRAEPPRVVGVRTTQRGGTWSTARGVSVALGLAGLGAIGGGVYYGLRADDLQERSDRICPLVTCTDVDGLRYNERAQDAALRANILYAAGGLAVASAAVLWLVGAPDERTVIVPAVGDGQAGVSLSRSF